MNTRTPRKKEKVDKVHKEYENETPNTRQVGFRAMDFGDYKSYVQIGCKVYLRHFSPDASGHLNETLLLWSAAQMKRDMRDAGKLRDVELVPRFVGMGCYPSHLDYRYEVAGNYNLYKPLAYQPSCGIWPNIEKMLRHLFDSQYELALDYIELLYLHPTQMLPILLFTSKERQTGKTTFLNFMKEVFGGNATIVNNDALRSPFNAERAGKLVIMCDEAMQNKKEDSERLKALSTAKTIHVEYKGRDRFEMDNFAKIVLCSNNTIDPVYIDPEEVRYWVREVPPLTEDNPNIMDAIKSEIPAFLYFLMSRPLSVPTAQSRMWFRPEDIHTPALAKIKRMCRPSVELDLAEFLLDTMDRFGVDILRYTNSNLQDLLRANGRDIRDAHRIISKVWGVPRANNKLAYDYYADWVDKQSKREYGRYYTFTRSFLAGLVQDTSSDSPAAPSPREPNDNNNSLLFP